MDNALANQHLLINARRYSTHIQLGQFGVLSFYVKCRYLDLGELTVYIALSDFQLFLWVCAVWVFGEPKRLGTSMLAFRGSTMVRIVFTGIDQWLLHFSWPSAFIFVSSLFRHGSVCVHAHALKMYWDGREKNARAQPHVQSKDNRLCILMIWDLMSLNL